MKEKDTLEQFIQQKLDEPSFPYQSAYWDQAAAQMAVWEAEDKRKRRFLWFYSLSGLILLVSGILSLFAFFPAEVPIITSVLETQNVRSKVVDPLSSKTASLSNLALTTDSSSRIPNDFKTHGTSLPPASASRSTSDTQTGPSSQVLTEELQLKKPDSLIRPSLSTSISSNLKYSLYQLPDRWYVLHTQLDQLKTRLLSSPERSFIRSLHWYIQSGTGLRLSAQSESGTNWQSQSAQLGLGVRLPLRPALALETGFSLQNMPINGLSLQLKGNQYDFVLREQSVRWDLQNLYWLNVPVQLSLRPMSRHELIIGASWQYLLSSRGELTTAFSDPFSTPTSETNTQNGISYGLRTHNISAQLAYRFYIQPRLALEAKYRYGFRNLLYEGSWIQTDKLYDRQLEVRVMFYLK